MFGERHAMRPGPKRQIENPGGGGRGFRESFVEEVVEESFDGYWFYRTMRDGKQRVHVYAQRYDKFLNDSTRRVENPQN